MRVMAPAEVTLSAVAATDFQQSGVLRGIFKARELVLGAQPEVVTRPKGLLAELKSLGWRVLVETAPATISRPEDYRRASL